MPIYKTNGEKDGHKKYIVRINYISDSGEHKQLTRVAYGSANAKNLELELNGKLKNKGEMPIRKIMVRQLYEEYKSVKQYEIRATTFAKLQQVFESHILPTFENHRIDRVTIEMIKDWKIIIREKQLALRTNKTVFTHFRAIFNYALKMEYLPKKPFAKIDNFKSNNDIEKEMQFYTAEEFKIFIRRAKEIASEREKQLNDLSEWNYYVFFNIAFYTGLRKGEIHALKWSDIKGSYLAVKRSVTQRLSGGDKETPPKNKSSIRTLQMPTPLIMILKEHQERQKIFHNYNEDFRICGSTRDTTIQRRNELYSKVLGKTIRIHDFRHSHVSILANEGINIQEIARRLGHSRIEITWNTYCHLYPKEEERAVQVLNSFDY